MWIPTNRKELDCILFYIFRVDVIDNKNSELNYLESKMKLFGMNEVPVREGPSSVNVFVSKVKNQPATSPKVTINTDNNFKRKRWTWFIAIFTNFF